MGKDIKKLGFGLMRLPKKDDKIDIEETKQMVDHFMAAGFNYFDTAWIYEGSEDAAREALISRYPRDSYYLATKNASWAGKKTREAAIEQFETSLRRTGAGYFDYYLLHNLGESRTQVFEDFGMWEFALAQKAAGKIRHVGFSFHASAKELDEILTKHPEAEFVQLQINYADWENGQIQSRACYEVARKHGKPVIIMEPVKGGLLAKPPKSVAEIFAAAEGNIPPAIWALRFTAELEGVLTVLSGMSSLAQMDENLKYMKDFTHLSDDERAVLNKAREAFEAIPQIPCTSCDYCAKVCPTQIGIAGTFRAMNELALYQDKAAAERRIGMDVDNAGKKRAGECIHCGLCEEACPQHIAIRDELDKAAAIF